MAGRVMLVGRRRRVLEPTAARLVARGFEVRWSTRAGSALTQVGAFAPQVLALGRGVTAHQRDALVAAFHARDEQLVVVDGLAPIPELLAAQVEQAARPAGAVTVTGVSKEELRLTLSEPRHVTVVQHRLTWPKRDHRDVVADADLPAGESAVPLPPTRGRRFLVVRAAGLAGSGPGAPDDVVVG